MPRRAHLLLLATLFAAPYLEAQRGTLLALSKGDHTLALVDPDTLQVLTRLPIGEDPHEVIASGSGTTAYVSNYGFGAFHTLARVDLVHRTTLPAIDLGALNGPHGLAFVDNELWFTAEGAKAIGRYSPATGKVDLILGTGQNRTHMIHVDPGSHALVTTNVSSGTVTLFHYGELPMPPPPPPSVGPNGVEAFHPEGAPPPGPPPNQPRRQDWNETVVKVGNGSEGFDVSPDGKEIWVANAEDGTISVLDRASTTVTATLHPDVLSANRLKFTPDGQHVLVSLLRNPDLVIFDAHTRTVIKRLPIGHGAAGILIEPGGRRAFLACSPDNNIAVLDLATLTVTAHINVGPNPDGLAWATIP